MRVLSKSHFLIAPLAVAAVAYLGIPKTPEAGAGETQAPPKIVGSLGQAGGSGMGSGAAAGMGASAAGGGGHAGEADTNAREAAVA